MEVLLHYFHLRMQCTHSVLACSQSDPCSVCWGSEVTSVSLHAQVATQTPEGVPIIQEVSLSNYHVVS